METEKISDRDFIKVVLIEDTMEISFKYSKRSTLKKRYELMDKLKEVLRTI